MERPSSNPAIRTLPLCDRTFHRGRGGGGADAASVNLTALARMAAGHPEAAVPLFEDLVARQPDMSFPVSSLLRAHAFLEDWEAVDGLLELAAKRSLREFEEGLAFIRTKRDPTPERVDGIRSTLEAHLAETGCVEVSRLVYAAHLGPRFPRLCARLGLVEFWTGTEKWPDCADEVPYDFRAECAKASGVAKEEFGY